MQTQEKILFGNIYGKLHYLVIVVLVLVTIALVAACSTSNFPKDPYEYSELKNVDVRLTIDKLKAIEVDKKENLFLYFNYQINNQSPEKIFFDPSTIRINADGTINTAVYYGSSLGSATTEQLELPTGESSYFLYAVYEDSGIKDGIKTITVEAFTK